MRKQELVYKVGWLIKRVYKESDKLLGKITDTTRFEDRCIQDLGEYIAKDADNIKNKKQLVRIINRRVKEAQENFKKEVEAIYISELETDDNDEEVRFDPEDVLANVESKVIANEMTALLAQDDHRKMVILGYWSIGNTNHALISRLLAQSLGGNIEAHRKAINRFRKDCHEYLESMNVAV